MIIFHSPGSALVKARVRNSCGWSQWSAASIIQVGSGGWFTMYPNPVSDELLIELEMSEEEKRSPNQLDKPVEIRIYAISGEELYQMESDDKQINIDVRRFKPVYYYIHLLNENGVDKKIFKIER